MYRMLVFVLDSTHVFVYVFFFQAEDGIRDLVRSRGLGDVYKRQGEHLRDPRSGDAADVALLQAERRRGRGQQRPRHPVSYTHLTLPTSDLV